MVAFGHSLESNSVESSRWTTQPKADSALQPRASHPSVSMILSVKLKTQEPSYSSLSSLIPASPIDEVATCCLISDDSEESVSDISSNGEPFSIISSKSPPRSIFKTYWEKNGGAVSLSKASTSSSIPIRCVSFPNEQPEPQDPALLCYEQALLAKEELLLTRRRIFGQGCWSKSEPLLNLKVLLSSSSGSSFPFRKTRSTSTLDHTTHSQRSCLRRGRFSSSGRIKSSDDAEDCGSDNGSVTFNEDVNVVVFDSPKELWAQRGWSDYFTC